MESMELPALPRVIRETPAITNLLWPTQSWRNFFVTIAVGLAVVTLLPGGLGRHSGRVLKWPTMVLFYSAVGVELVLYGLVRLLIRLVEASSSSPRGRRLRRAMNRAGSYGEWYKIASELDARQQREKWQRDLDDYTAHHFSWSLLRQLMADMRTARGDGDVKMALAVLQQCIRKNVGGTMAEELYSYTYTGEPKIIVRDFVEEVVKTLRWVTERARGSDDERLSGEVTDFLRGTRSTYGRTALCLSGGAMMALYHLGTVRALLEEGVLPFVISGSSAGSLIAALTCTRTDDELRRDLVPEVVKPYFICCARTWPERIRSLWETGAMFDNDEWLRLLNWFACGNLTFAEAHSKTGRTLCITLSTKTIKAPPIVLNHISAPNVLIASAVVASSAVPGVLRPMYLREKKPDGSIKVLPEEYWDGSIEQDIPLLGLAEMLNCQFFIAAQCNPHIVPFVFNADGNVGMPTHWKNSRRGGHLLSGLELYLKMDMRFKLKFLREVGAVVGVTSKLMIQDLEGTTNIVPRVRLTDYFKLVSDPTLDDLSRYFQGGSVAAYRNCAHIKLHYQLQRALCECLSSLDRSSGYFEKTILQEIMESKEEEKKDDDKIVQKTKRYSLLSSNLTGVVSRASYPF